MTQPPFAAPQSKQEVVNLLTTYRNKFSEVLHDLTDDELLRVPGPQKNRSMKDLLAHLIWWEEYMMMRVLLVKTGITSFPTQDNDKINEMVFQMHRELSLEVVRESFQFSLHRLLGFIDWLTWDEIEGDLSSDGRPVAYLIAGNTFGHYVEHLDAVSRYIDSLRISG